MSLPERPKRLGPYDVIAKIAGGGFATIYLGRAKGESGIDRVAAIKVIRHDLMHDGQMVQMFLEEAKLLSRLSHPNIIRTLEFGVSGEQHFIAMELLTGRTLFDVWQACVERNLTLRLDVAAWICARVANALHYAHELRDEHGASLGLIHRDVNPTNIFLTYDGEVKLFDFGLAKAEGRPKSSSGIVKGKLPYLSPEQVMQFPFDRRADIFTLGTTLWELSTMRRLFKRDSDLDTVKAVRTFPVPDPRQLVPGLPESLARAIGMALERNRDHRYPSAAALAHDLDAVITPSARAQIPGVISGIVDTLFPGERAKQMGWLKHTQAERRMPQATIPPPAPVPIGGDRGVSIPPPLPMSVRSPPSKPPTPSMPPMPPKPPMPSNRPLLPRPTSPPKRR